MDNPSRKLCGVFPAWSLDSKRLLTEEPVKGLFPTDPLRSVTLKRYPWSSEISRLDELFLLTIIHVVLLDLLSHNFSASSVCLSFHPVKLTHFSNLGKTVEFSLAPLSNKWAVIRLMPALPLRDSTIFWFSKKPRRIATLVSGLSTFKAWKIVFWRVPLLRGLMVLWSPK